MTPHQLRTLVAVVETGSVRSAARQLVVSQPAVSAALASLQAELGIALVEREGRGLRITRAGVVLADYGRRITGLMEEAVLATRSEADPTSGTLRLAAVTTAGEHVVPAVLASFRLANPAIEMMLEVGNRTRVWDLLSHGAVDLAVGGRPPVGLLSLARRPHELVVVSAPGASLAGDAQRCSSSKDRGLPSKKIPVVHVDLGALAASTWLVREEGSGTLATTQELFESLGIAPLCLTLGSNGAVVEAVRNGLGIALISRDAVAHELADGELVECQTGNLPLLRHWHLVARPGRLPATSSLFVDHLVKAGAFLSTQGDPLQLLEPANLRQVRSTT
ncbi:MAG: LysR family transcriptional regulator [Actinobacteria bacterium]|nr:LysR family transcriptional regulator [Actinomycetota bacterium]